jgi:competence protein ComEC
MDLVLASGIMLVAGALACVAPVALAVGSVAAAAVLWWGGARLSRALVLAGALSAVVGGARGFVAVGEHETLRAIAWQMLPSPARCTADAEVVSSPVETHGLVRWDGDLQGVSCDGHDLLPSFRVRANLYGGPDDLARGDRLRVTVQVATVERFWNAATGDPRPGDTRRGALWSGSVVATDPARRGRGPLARIDRARAYVRGRIGATFPEDARAMARALVLGESDLSDTEDADFRASGLAHLLAVSGMHLILVVAGARKALDLVLLRVPRLAAAGDVGRTSAGVALPLVWVYAEFAGAGGSTLRAAWMMTTAMLGRAAGRRGNASRAFGLSLIAMAVADPLVVFDLSFLLSAAATGGLIALSTPIDEELEIWVKRLPGKLGRVTAWLAHAGAPTLAATIPCTPILARFAPTQPLGGVIANLLAVPLGEAISLPVCLLHVLAAPLPRVEMGAALVATGALRIVRLIAHSFAHFQPLLVPVPPPNEWQVTACALLFVTFVACEGRRRRCLAAVLVAATLLLEVVNVGQGAPKGALRATFLDVGQGDSALVDLPDGQAIVIDGGGIVGSPVDTGTRVVAPTLRQRRRSRIAAVVLSHPHPDHFTGLVSGLDAVSVGALWDTGQGEREGARGGYASLLANMRRARVPVLRPDTLCGTRMLGGAEVEVLAPCPGPSPDRGPNDNSLVLRVAFGRRAFLFVGDSEHAAEADLVALGGGRLRADVLKVGHHGSRTSTSRAFLDAVAPRFAIISVGLRNRFGHPHPNTLATLRDAGVKVFRTDADGAVMAWTDGERLVVAPEGE